jgi:tRNA(Ile)-lysidine synthase
MSFLRSITEFLQKFRLLANGDRILIAVSGGPDSVALLHILCDLRDELGLHLEVAHLQHGIRGAEAAADARFVAELAEKLQLPFHLKEVDLPQMKSDAGKGNLEALARAERYHFFGDIAQQRRLDKVATAHTQDDQAETMLMWFLRGAGAKGLGGMAPLQKLRVAGGETTQELVVVRPLLEISKAELLQYLSDRQFAYRMDKSNQDPAFLRNWIRTELLPMIGRRIDPRVPVRLGQLGELLRDENSYLDDLARERLTGLLGKDELTRGGLLDVPTALRRRILRLWIKQTRGQLRGLDFVHIEEMLRLIAQGPPQGRVSIPGGWELERQYERLRLTKRSRKLPRVCYSYPLEIGSVLTIPEAHLLIHSRTVAAPLRLPPPGLMEAMFDLNEVGGSLSVRNFRRGDRFQPLGMKGHKKVKDLFIEKRVPLPIRACWPLLAHGDEIIWIPGYGRSETGRVGEKTAAILELNAAAISS